MELNLNQLRLFFAVAEEGSVTRGADRALVSQPAVSQSIAELEGAVGARLFDRHPKGVRLTEAGEVLHRYAGVIFQTERDAVQALRDLSGVARGRLTIGASTTIGDYLLPMVIGRFLDQYPGVEVSLEVLNTGLIQAGVSSGRLDFGLTEGDAKGETFDVTVFAEDELVMVGAPGKTWNGGELRLVMREGGSGTRAVVERGLRAAGITPVVVAEVGSTTAVKSLVAQGIGFGFISAMALEVELQMGALTRVPTELTMRRRLHCVRQLNRTASAAVSAFLSVLSPRS